MRITADEVLELARRCEASDGFEATPGVLLRKCVKDELDRIARRTVNWSARGIVIAILAVPVPVFVFFVMFGTTTPRRMMPLLAAVLAIALTIRTCHMTANDRKDYGKLLAAYRMLGGDESRLEPYSGIDAAERVAAGLHGRR